MNEIPSTPAEFLAQLLTIGTLYGLVTTWLIDGLIALWEAHAGGAISGTKRRWISIAVALAVPVAAYLGLIALGQAVWSADGLYSAALVGVAAVSGGKLAYAARESLSKPGEDPADRAAPDASGDPDLPNGGHPAPQTAPLPAFAGYPQTPEHEAAYEAMHAGLPTVQEAAMRPPQSALHDAPRADAGGPSLHDKLAADMGLPPERDTTPEDTI